MDKIIKFRCPKCGIEKLDRKVKCEASEINVALISYFDEVIVDYAQTATKIDDYGTIEELYYECSGCDYGWNSLKELADDNALLNSDGVPVDDKGQPKA